MTDAIDNVHKFLAYKPFRRFWLETIGGTKILVTKPEWFLEMSEGPIFIFDGAGVTVTYWHDLTETVQIDNPPATDSL